MTAAVTHPTPQQHQLQAVDIHTRKQTILHLIIFHNILNKKSRESIKRITLVNVMYRVRQNKVAP